MVVHKFADVPYELYFLRFAVHMNLAPAVLLEAGRALRWVWQCQSIEWLVDPSQSAGAVQFKEPHSLFLFAENSVFHHALVQKGLPVSPFMWREGCHRPKRFIDPSLCLAAIQFSFAFDQASELAGDQPPIANLDWTWGPHDWQTSWLPVTFSAWLHVLRETSAVLKKVSPKINKREGNALHVQAIRILNQLSITVPMGDGTDAPTIRIHFCSPRVSDRQRFNRWFQNAAKGKDVSAEIWELLQADMGCKEFMEKNHSDPKAPELDANPVMQDATQKIYFARYFDEEPVTRKRNRIGTGQRGSKKKQRTQSQEHAEAEGMMVDSDGIEELLDITMDDDVDYELLDL